MLNVDDTFVVGKLWFYSNFNFDYFLQNVRLVVNSPSTTCHALLPVMTQWRGAELPFSLPMLHTAAAGVLTKLKGKTTLCSTCPSNCAEIIQSMAQFSSYLLMHSFTLSQWILTTPFVKISIISKRYLLGRCIFLWITSFLMYIFHQLHSHIQFSYYFLEDCSNW